MATEPAVIAAQLRVAVGDLRVRGLTKATQFAAELLLGIGDAAASHKSSQKSWKDDTNTDEFEDWAEADRYEAARTCFDMGEYLRAHHFLSLSTEGCVGTCRSQTHKTHFLRNYSLFLVRKRPDYLLNIEL